MSRTRKPGDRAERASGAAVAEARRLRLKLRQAVRADGTLDAARVLARTALGAGMNGRVVERFTLHARGAEESYIFKPLTHADTAGRERWAHRRLLPQLRAVRTAKLLCSGGADDAERGWSIFEDLGPLLHTLSASELAQAAALLPHWQRLPTAALPARWQGNKPPYAAARAQLALQWEAVARLAGELGLGEGQRARLRQAIDAEPAGLFGADVVSHGDLHRGNIALAAGEWVIIDWEYVHRNTIYWDLFHLIDGTHPLLRRRTTERVREQMLASYWEAAREVPGLLAPQLGKEALASRYALFSSVYSAWLLLLIEGDLRCGSWPEPALRAAQAESLDALTACLRLLG